LGQNLFRNFESGNQIFNLKRLVGAELRIPFLSKTGSKCSYFHFHVFSVYYVLVEPFLLLPEISPRKASEATVLKLRFFEEYFN